MLVIGRATAAAPLSDEISDEGRRRVAAAAATAAEFVHHIVKGIVTAVIIAPSHDDGTHHDGKDRQCHPRSDEAGEGGIDRLPVGLGGEGHQLLGGIFIGT